MSTITSGTWASPTIAGSRLTAVLVAANDIEVREIELDPLADGWARVRVSFICICGSDFSIIAGSHPRVILPLIMGHEISGVIEDPGTGAIPAETRVAVNPLIECGECGACRQGLFHVCRNLRLRGIDVDGSMTELMDVPISSLSAFDEGVDPHSAALAEPLAVAVHSVHRSGLIAGESVLIFGAGPIGMLIALVARNSGAGTITLVEPSVGRRIVAEKLGFLVAAPDDVHTSRDLGDDNAPSLVFDCAGHPSVSSIITDIAPVRGRIVIVAAHKGKTEFDLRELCFAEQTIIGIRVYEHADFEESVALINSGVLRLSELPISEYPLERVQEAFAEARSADRAAKVLIKSTTTTTQRT